MPKQLSLFAQDEWSLDIISSFPEEKKAEAVSAVKELLIADFSERKNMGEQHEKGEN